jgi:serine/threonine protein kinase
MQLFLDLHHPHVVACYGILKERVESEDGASSPRMKNSIVTERCRKPLDHFLAEHSEWMGLGGDEIDLRKYTILHHVSLGLQKLHDMGVLHRDIKGGNLLLDGVPKTCDTCQHAGKWKICDFGEAKVLKRPSLQFSDAQPWPKGWSGSLSYQPITSPFLRDQGARHYCWLPSGQVLEPATNHDPPPTPKNCGRNHAITNDDHRWTPCPHSGGFVYSFSEDPSHHDARDCFFSLSGVTGDTTSANLVPFPKSLGPFGLSPTELLPVVDFESLTYQLRSTLYQNPQLQLLKTMLPEGGTIEGKISPPCRITLSDSERRQALIPPGATHFAWAYQAVDLEELSAEQNKQLEKDSGEMLFVSLGGFLYFDSVEVGDDRDTIRYGSVIKANAIGAGLGLKCRIGTIDRPEDDDNLTATIASPEMFEGKGIGLETDVFAFGVVMWEVFTRREVRAHSALSSILAAGSSS